MTEIPIGADLREPQWRREIFHRFYEFHLRHRSHPGGVYYLMPFLAEREGWDDEQRLWYAFINGNTQHPLTSLLLMRQAPTPRYANRMLRFYQEHYERLSWDTDRRHHKNALDVATQGYLQLVGQAGSQRAYWDQAAEGGWARTWQAATAIPTFGRLTAFSYLEYVRIMGRPIVCTDLMIGDIAGSRSHRNGLCIVTGRDDHDWSKDNPDVRYGPNLIARLTQEAEELRVEAMARHAHPDTGYFTLESALCTYKSWHRKNRRYPNVYNDMLYDRIRKTEERWGEEIAAPFWEARAATQPGYLLLERNPHDPGLAPVKQNQYRETGQIPMMGHEWPELWSAFDQGVRDGTLGVFR